MASKVWRCTAVVAALMLVAIASAPVRANPEYSVEASAYAAARGVSLAEADRSIALREKMDPAIAAIDQDRNSFGGAFITHDGDITLNVAIVRDAVVDLSTLNSLLPTEVSVRIQFVDYSRAELDRVKRAIAVDEMVLPLFSMSYVDIKQNQVGLVLERENGSVRNHILETYGDIVRIEYGHKPRAAANCDNRLSCTPRRGGNALFRINPSSGQPQAWCTAGFNARRNTNGAQQGTTAGHCGTRDWYHPEAVGFGATSFNVQDHTVSGSIISCDCQRYNYANVTHGTPRNIVWHSSGLPDYAINGVKATSGQVVGSDVFRNGMSSGTDLAEVTAVDVDWYPDGYPAQVLVTGNAVSPASTGGDSGGPLYWQAKAWGIVYGTAPQQSWTLYMLAASLQSSLGVTICTTSGC